MQVMQPPGLRHGRMIPSRGIRSRPVQRAMISLRCATDLFRLPFELIFISLELWQILLDGAFCSLVLLSENHSRVIHLVHLVLQAGSG